MYIYIMPRRRQQRGGKIKIKSAKEIGRDIKKGFNKEVAKPLEKAFSKENMNKAEKFLKNEVAPELTSIAIPLASTALGAVGEYFGGPIGAAAAQSLSQNLMEEYIPKKYQSKNKYTKFAGDALSQLASGAFSGEFDPMAAQDLGNQFLGMVGDDLAGKPKTPNDDHHEDGATPYDDLIYQLMSNYYSPKIAQQAQMEQVNFNATSDAIYKDSQISDDADRIQIKTSPYQQREGSMMGILGAGLKKKKRPMRAHEIQEVIIRQTIPSMKFKGAKNASLEQLLEANMRRQEKEDKKAMRELMKHQTSFYRAMGHGLYV